MVTGGRPGILNLNMIESALGRPYCGYYRPIARKAAALVQSMATNHGFIDGNKRTTLILAITFVARSGYELVSPNPGGDLVKEIEELIVSVAEHLPFEDIVEWFTLRLRKAAS